MRQRSLAASAACSRQRGVELGRVGTEREARQHREVLAEQPLQPRRSHAARAARRRRRLAVEQGVGAASSSSCSASSTAAARRPPSAARASRVAGSAPARRSRTPAPATPRAAACRRCRRAPRATRRRRRWPAARLSRHRTRRQRSAARCTISSTSTPGYSPSIGQRRFDRRRRARPGPCAWRSATCRSAPSASSRSPRTRRGRVRPRAAVRLDLQRGHGRRVGDLRDQRRRRRRRESRSPPGPHASRRSHARPSSTADSGERPRSAQFADDRFGIDHVLPPVGSCDARARRRRSARDRRASHASQAFSAGSARRAPVLGPAVGGARTQHDDALRVARAAARRARRPASRSAATACRRPPSRRAARAEVALHDLVRALGQQQVAHAVGEVERIVQMRRHLVPARRPTSGGAG